ncbi:MAG: VCBS repeat-containing protein, partial [Chloroflexi bacterium]|nr:VCBS repeat-containing protein [Chloroflexota bacterium]
MPRRPRCAATIRKATLGPGLALLLAACSGAGSPAGPVPRDGASDDGRTAAPPAAPTEADASGGAEGFARPAFVEAAAALGLDFVHHSGRSGQRYFPEINGPGSALFDADGDGDLDLYLVQGGSLEAGPDPALAGRLYRNRLREDGRLGFEDMTADSGLVADGYGMGAAAGDIDNDGDLDLYLTNFGPNQLWRNLGGGRFEDVTQAAGEGLDDPRWSTSAAFVDYDRDGWLDLVVSTYTDFTLAGHKACYAPNGAIDYCGPLSYDPLPDRLMHNLGDGRFEDVTATAGLGAAYGPGLGVAVADFDADGWPDIYVANDGMPNQLWINRDGQRFDDTALLAGVAMNAKGAAEAGMGVVADDLDGDLDVDLFMTHLTDETNTLYVNDGTGLFEDATARSGLGGASLPYTGFGVGSLDIDGDGWLDLLVSNGAVRINPAQLGLPQDPADPQAAYRMPRQVYRNLAGR